MRGDSGEFYGVLGPHVVMLDTEAEFSYLCTGLENFPFWYRADKDMTETEITEWYHKQGIDYTAYLHDYTRWCAQQGCSTNNTGFDQPTAYAQDVKRITS